MRYSPLMKHLHGILNLVVAAALAVMLLPGIGGAQPQDGARADVDALLAELARPDQERWQRIERQILREWSRSGSAAVDYLFERGQTALRAGDATAAIAHFSAVIDHAPDFAEGWNARATAYFMVNRIGQSMADIEQTLSRNPQHFGALAGMGTILEQLGRAEQAREAYAAAHALHPHRASVREALSRLERQLAGRDA
ncbi:MAG: tetratricopeptide repeat protein [Pararhodobacter sp.]